MFLDDFEQWYGMMIMEVRDVRLVAVWSLTVYAVKDREGRVDGYVFGQLPLRIHYCPCPIWQFPRRARPAVF